jgi:hypothetical protein
VTDSYGPGTEPETHDQISDTLRALAGGYPEFRFFREPRGWHRQLRWVAERVTGGNPGLHTVITADLTELHAALAHDRARFQ